MTTPRNPVSATSTRRRGASSADVRARAPAATLAVAALISAASGGALGQQPNIIGKWEWTRRSNGCSEQYDFRDDGVLAVRSGESRTENSFRMAWAPEPNGRYRMSLTTVKDLGGRDCVDATADRTGQQRVVYILFGQSRETMILCGSAGGADCIGPLRRTAP